MAGTMDDSASRSTVAGVDGGRVQRGRRLVARADRASFALGDLALEVAPRGGGEAGSGSDDRLAAFADAIGTEYWRLFRHRDVAAAWPPAARIPGLSWSAHRELIGAVRVEGADAVRALVEEVAREHGDRVTVTALRERVTAERARREAEWDSERVTRPPEQGHAGAGGVPDEEARVQLLRDVAATFRDDYDRRTRDALATHRGRDDAIAARVREAGAVLRSLMELSRPGALTGAAEGTLGALERVASSVEDAAGALHRNITAARAALGAAEGARDARIGGAGAAARRHGRARGLTEQELEGLIEEQAGWIRWAADVDERYAGPA